MEEMVNIDARDLEPVPAPGATISADGILAIARINGVVENLLDIDGIVARDTARISALAA
jgi:chemotaxis signal transduction protein